MKTTIERVDYDTENAELIANHDAENNGTATYLYRTKEGRYFLHIEKIQVHRRGVWRDHPMDGTAKGPSRFANTIKPLSEERAIDWAIGTLLPGCLATLIQDRIGKLVSFDLGDLAGPLARYCKDKGVTASHAVERAILSGIVSPAGDRESRQNETEKAIVHLQNAVARRFGCDFDTDSGRGTIYISHDGVSLTNPRSTIVAQRANSIARHLTGSPS
jgi:hypothetical protein